MAVGAPSPTASRRRSSSGTRKVGYAIAAVVNAVLLYLVNVNPGWDAFSFVTDDFSQVLGLLNASLVVGLVMNLVWVVADPPWWRSLGQVITSGIGLGASLQLLDVFPFDFSDWAFDPTWLVRFLLIVGAFGMAMSLLVESVKLVRMAVGQQGR